LDEFERAAEIAEIAEISERPIKAVSKRSTR
jgi:hypothetical protein